MAIRRKAPAVVLATATLVFAVTVAAASATTVRTGSATGPAYSGPISGVNAGNVVLATNSGFGNIICTGSMISASVTSSGAVTVTAWTLSNCTNNLGQTCTLTPQNLNWTGALSFQSLASTPNATLVISGSPYAGWMMVCGSTTCYYGASSFTVDFNNPSGGSGSQLVVNVTLSRQPGSSFLCASSATLSGRYDVTENGTGDLYATA